MKHRCPNTNMIRGSWAGPAARVVAGAGWKVRDCFNYLPGNSKSKTGSYIFRGRYITSTKRMHIYIYLQNQHLSVQGRSSEGSRWATGRNQGKTNCGCSYYLTGAHIWHSQNASALHATWLNFKYVLKYWENLGLQLRPGSRLLSQSSKHHNRGTLKKKSNLVQHLLVQEHLFQLCYRQNMHIVFPQWSFAQWEKLRHNSNFFFFLVSGKITSSRYKNLPVPTYSIQRYQKIHHSVLIGNSILNALLFSFCY